MNKSLIFFDIDGTLITEDDLKILPQSTIRAIKTARENGHLVFINTGRTFLNLDDFIKDIGFDGYVCGCGTYIQYNNKVLLHNKLDDKLCKKIGYLSRDCKIYCIFEAAYHNAIDLELCNHPRIERLRKRFLKNGHEIKMFLGDEDFSFDKFTIWYDNNSDLETFKEEISDYFQYIHRGEGFGEIIPHGFSKATGIKFLQDYFDIRLNDCYAIGDSTNDLPMLKFVPNSIAMGNSMEEILGEVSFVTKDILDNGVEFALQHYGLI